MRLGFRIGPFLQVLGRPLTSLAVSSLCACRCDSTTRRCLRTCGLASGSVPARVSGVIDSMSIRGGTPLALAVNGRVAAMAREALVPEDAFHDGQNEVDVFAVAAVRGRPVLTPLGEAPRTAASSGVASHAAVSVAEKEATSHG